MAGVKFIPKNLGHFSVSFSSSQITWDTLRVSLGAIRGKQPFPGYNSRDLLWHQPQERINCALEVPFLLHLV